jgi:hypothetical protein
MGKVFLQITEEYSVYSYKIVLGLFHLTDCFSPKCNEYLLNWGTRLRNWLRHCATSLEVAGSIPDWSLEFLIDIILSAALWPWFDSASNRNEYQEYLLVVGGAGWGVKATGA